MAYTFELNPVSDERYEQLLANERHQDGVGLSSHSSSIVSLLPRCTSPARIGINVLQIGSLGLGPNATWHQLHVALYALQLHRVPQNLILPLRFAYNDQPEDEFIEIAHDPVLFKGQMRRFVLYNNGQKILYEQVYGGDDSTCLATSRIACVRWLEYL